MTQTPHTVRHRASVILVRERTVLLVRRRNAGREYFVFPGGGIEAGESPEQSAVREAKEEAGIGIFAERILARYVDATENVSFFIICRQLDKKEPAWNEAYKQASDNSYSLEWIPLGELSSLNVLPLVGRGLVLAHYAGK
jgi:8-oxo-dGTP diphosphatase